MNKRDVFPALAMLAVLYGPAAADTINREPGPDRETAWPPGARFDDAPKLQIDTAKDGSGQTGSDRDGASTGQPKAKNLSPSDRESLTGSTMSTPPLKDLPGVQKPAGDSSAKTVSPPKLPAGAESLKTGPGRSMPALHGTPELKEKPQTGGAKNLKIDPEVSLPAVQTPPAKGLNPPAGDGRINQGIQAPLPSAGGAAPDMLPGAGRTPPRGAADAIRDAAAARMSVPEIDRVGGECVTDRVVLYGRRFGDTQGARELWLLSTIRKRPIAEMSVTSWSDTRIEAAMPSTRQAPAGDYIVAILAGGETVSNISRRLRRCPSEFRISGDVRISNCSAGPSNVRVAILEGSRVLRRVNGQSVPGNDFAVRYEARIPAQRSQNISIRPELIGITCRGGSWAPEVVDHTLTYSRPSVNQPFEYRVGVQTRRIPMSVVSGLLRTAFRGTEVHINNYNPATGRVLENDSFVRLSDQLGGVETRFNIPPAETGPRRYYINDINLATIGVAPAGPELKVTMTFEQNGMEFIGTCGQDGFDAGCIAGAPDVQASIVVDIFLSLERYYSRSAPVSLSFGAVRVVATPNAQADGLCLAFDFLCTMVNNYHELIKDTIESSFMFVLDSQRVRDDVANALLPVLRDLRIGTLQSVRIEGGNLVLTYLEDV